VELPTAGAPAPAARDVTGLADERATEAANSFIPAQAGIHLRPRLRERSYETNYDQSGFAPIKRVG
jgi:hypothetical protein